MRDDECMTAVNGVLEVLLTDGETITVGFAGFEGEIELTADQARDLVDLLLCRLEDLAARQQWDRSLRARTRAQRRERVI